MFSDLDGGGGGYSDEHNKTNRKLIDISIVYENVFNMLTPKWRHFIEYLLCQLGFIYN